MPCVLLFHSDLQCEGNQPRSTFSTPTSDAADSWMVRWSDALLLGIDMLKLAAAAAAVFPWARIGGRHLCLDSCMAMCLS
jgi:hypothetical protein